MVKVQDFRSRFGFHATPFTREIAVQDRFSLSFFDEALEAVSRTLEARMSCALIAPAGTGKTSLLRAVLARLPEARYRTHYVKTTGLSKRDMCREIASSVGLAPAGTYPALVRKLEQHFVEAADGAGLRPVLFLDEAHDLRPDVLAMLRLLTNFDMDSRLVLSVVLAGQPPLRDLLRRDELEDVARRLAHYATLRTLSREEVGRYVEHRCTVAGATSVPFDQAALDALFEIGRGNLRATDQLARKALELAHEADRDVCEPSHLAQARKCLWP
jgi:type II secretory pathway predicted ATPase ExeA